MASDKPATVIKKYANRRLYHMGTSTYVTLEDLAMMVRKGEDFVVTDAKSGDDITRAVLGQIIFEQENKQGQNLLPTAFLRQLIRFYGDSLEALVPRYLEFSMDNLTRDQQKLRDQMAATFGSTAFHALEDQVRTNMSFFSDAMRVWTPFGLPGADAANKGMEKGADKAVDKAVDRGSKPAKPDDVEPARDRGDIDELKRQMADMQSKLETLSKT